MVAESSLWAFMKHDEILRLTASTFKLPAKNHLSVALTDDGC